MLQFHRDTDLCGWLCTLYWLHTLSGQNRIQLATACKGWRGRERRQTALLLHFDEEESGSQASQGNRQQTWLKCSSGIMHLKTLSSSAQANQEFTSCAIRGLEWRGPCLKCTVSLTQKWLKAMPCCILASLYHNCHLQSHIWLHPLLKTDICWTTMMPV